MSEYEIHVTEYRGWNGAKWAPFYEVEVRHEGGTIERRRGFYGRAGAKRAGKKIAKEHANPRRTHWLYRVKA